MCAAAASPPTCAKCERGAPHRSATREARRLLLRRPAAERHVLLRLRQCLRRRVGGNGGAAAPAARVVPPGRAERVPSTVDHRMPRTTPAEDARVPATLSVARDRCRASIHISRLRGSACRAVGLRRSLSWSADWCRERGGAGRVVPPPYGRCRGLLGVWPYVRAQRRAVSRIPYRVSACQYYKCAALRWGHAAVRRCAQSSKHDSRETQITTTAGRWSSRVQEITTLCTHRTHDTRSFERAHIHQDIHA